MAFNDQGAPNFFRGSAHGQFAQANLNDQGAPNFFAGSQDGVFGLTNPSYNSQGAAQKAESGGFNLAKWLQDNIFYTDAQTEEINRRQRARAASVPPGKRGHVSQEPILVLHNQGWKDIPDGPIGTKASGGYLGPAYGDPTVLIGDSNLSNLPVDTRDAEIKLRQQQGGYLPPGMNAPVLNNPAADQERNRKSEADRMMQQYASDEYWDTEAGKAMLELGAQERYTGDDLAGFYDAQQAVGEGSIEEIIDAMGYTGNMAEWARANKALALREYLKNSEALPDDGYAGYGTGELQVDERLKDVTNQFLQQRVDQLKDREDGPLWGPAPGDPPPVVQTQEQTPSLPGFQLPGELGQINEAIQSLGLDTGAVLNQIDETGRGLAEKAGEWYGGKKAQEVPGANLPFIGPVIIGEGEKRGRETAGKLWDKHTNPFLQQN